MSAVCALTNISRRYGRVWAIKNVSIVIDGGDIVGLVGPNGAGKTSLLRIAAGILRQTAGQVLRPGRAPKAVRYFAGERALPPDLSVAAWWKLWTGTVPDGAARRRIGTLSRGTRQRLGLETAMALGRTGSVKDAFLLLDEPWEGLDPDAARWLSAELQAWRRGGAGVLVSSHRIHDLAEVCDRCVFLKHGAVAEEISLTLAPDRSARLFETFDRIRGEQ